jgi:hypothetical protein
MDTNTHMSHINLHAPTPPKLYVSGFTNWQSLMKQHIFSASTQVWRTILVGYNPYDPTNLTTREEVDEKLNTTGLFIIQSSMSLANMAHVLTLETTK